MENRGQIIKWFRFCEDGQIMKPNYFGNVFIRSYSGIIKTIASYSSVKIIVWLLAQAFWRDVIKVPNY